MGGKTVFGSTVDIVAPIFVSEGPGNVKAFPSLADAESWLEPWWVDGGEGLIFDSMGQMLAGLASGDRVVLGCGTLTAETRAMLRELLQADLTHRGIPFPEDCETSTLVSLY